MRSPEFDKTWGYGQKKERGDELLPISAIAWRKGSDFSLICGHGPTYFTTPRVVYGPFVTFQEVSRYFWDIPLHGDRIVCSNKTLMAHAKFLSSGEIK